MRGDRSRSASVRAPRSSPSRTAPWVERDSRRRRRSRPAWRLSLRQSPVASQPSLRSPEQAVNASAGCGRPGASVPRRVGLASHGPRPGSGRGDRTAAGPNPWVLTAPPYLRQCLQHCPEASRGQRPPGSERRSRRKPIRDRGWPGFHDRSAPSRGEPGWQPLMDRSRCRWPNLGVADMSDPIVCPCADRLRRRRELHGDGKFESVTEAVWLDPTIECRVNLPLHFVRLALNERRGSDRTRQQTSPQFVRGRHRLREGDCLDVDAFEPLVAEQACELLLIGEPKERRSDRDLLRRLGSRLGHGIEKHTEKAGPLGDVPNCERKPSTRGEDAEELCGCRLGPSEVKHREIPDHRIERAIGKRERLGVADAEVELRMKPTGNRHHRLGDVHAYDRCTSLGSAGGRISRTRGNVQHPHTPTSVDGVKQLFDEAASDLAEEIVVAGGLQAPSRHLKRAEGLFVDRRLPQRPILQPGAKGYNYPYLVAPSFTSRACCQNARTSGGGGDRTRESFRLLVRRYSGPNCHVARLERLMAIVLVA
jgi:hypothetical protein